MVQYHKLSNTVGYWVIKDIDSIVDFDKFKLLIKKSKFTTKNPFNPFNNQKISHIDQTHTILNFLEEFYHTYVNKSTPTKKEYDAWTNLYEKKKFKCMSAGLIPHVDSVNLSTGIVANMWLNKKVSGSGTKLYRYSGKIIQTNYGSKIDFMVDPSHKLYTKFHSMTNTDLNEFVNNDWSSWGFEYLGMAPSEYKTMTIYKINTPHTAFIPENVIERYSASFLYAAFNPIILS